MQILSVKAYEGINIPNGKDWYSKPSLAINFMAKNKDAEDKIKSQSSIYDSGSYDILWEIQDMKQKKTALVLFPRKNAFSYSSSSHNTDTNKFSYFFSQSLLPTQMNTDTVVHIFSSDAEHSYWEYRGLYIAAKQLKLSAPIEQSTSLQDGTALTISGDTQMFLSVWAKTSNRHDLRALA